MESQPAAAMGPVLVVGSPCPPNGDPRLSKAAVDSLTTPRMEHQPADTQMSSAASISDTLHAYMDQTFFIKSFMETCNNSSPIIVQSKGYSILLNMQLL